MANASDTQAVLHTINEEVHEGERDTWRTTEDPVVIANFRAAAKSNHTKQLRKIEAALVDPLVSSERLSDMRKIWFAVMKTSTYGSNVFFPS